MEVWIAFTEKKQRQPINPAVAVFIFPVKCTTSLQEIFNYKFNHKMDNIREKFNSNKFH